METKTGVAALATQIISFRLCWNDIIVANKNPLVQRGKVMPKRLNLKPQQ